MACFVVAARCVAGSTGVRADSAAPSLLETYVAIDESLSFESAEVTGVPRLSCAGSAPSTACLVRDFLSRELRPVPHDASLAENTVSNALRSQRGSCAALVALFLALKPEDFGAEAVVLRNHVVVGSAERTDRYFDLTERGQILSIEELSKFGPLPPGGPIRVHGEGFIAYYLDNLGARLAAAGRPAAAEEAFRRALGLAPGAARIHYNLASFLMASGRWREAAEEFRRALEFGWEDSETWHRLGLAHRRLDEVQLARRAWVRALELDPDNQSARSNLEALGGPDDGSH